MKICARGDAVALAVSSRRRRYHLDGTPRDVTSRLCRFTMNVRINHRFRFSPLMKLLWKDGNISGNNGRKRHLSLCWTEGIFYELKARHISMTPCCLLYALPIYLQSLDSVLWLYSCKGRSFHHRPSIQSTGISTFINRLGWFDSLQTAFEVIGSLLMLLTVLCSFVILNPFPLYFASFS